MALIDNLVAHWSLEESSGNAIDAHGSNDLTETGGTIASTTGKVGNCRDFEAGDTKHFQIADNADLSMGDIDFSIACWVNLESKPGGTDTLILGKAGGTDGEYYLQHFNAGGEDRFRITVHNTTGYGGSGQAIANNLGAPSTATWYFLVCRHNATANTLSICVNDGTPDSTSHSGGTINGTDAFLLGGFGTLALQYFDGLIDEVGIWKRVLSDAEVTELYNSGSGRDYTYISGGSPPDTTDPELDTAVIPEHGASVELTFDEAVTGVNEQDFNVDVGGFPMGLADQTGSGTGWELPFSRRWVRDGEVATLDYTGTATIDAATNQLQTIGGQSVTNNSIITDKMVRYVGRGLGLFLSFSVNTFLDEDHTGDGNGTFPDDFPDPDDFDPTEDLEDCVDQWVLCAKRMGAQYVVLTTKHHEGFKLWPSAHGYDISECSWWAGAGSPDLVDIFTTKVRAAGLGVGLYYSIWDKYFEAAAPGGTYTAWAAAEITELLSNYGAIDLLWFDGWNWVDDVGAPIGDAPDYTDVTLATIQSTVSGLQPSCAFVNNSHIAVSDPEGNFDSSDVAIFEGGTVGDQVPSDNLWPAEEIDTIRTDNMWFWKTDADNPLSLATLLATLAQVNSRRGAFLLNVPPDTSGMIPDQEFRRAAELGMSTLEPTLNVASEGAAAGGGLVGLQSIESGVIG